jgi:Electron transfer flavoprotein domain
VRFALCLHGAAVMRSATRLHETDLRAIAQVRALGAEVVAVEAVGERGSAPLATGAAIEAGAEGAVRLVDPALVSSDADATGYAFASLIDTLKVDLVLFGCGADPAGLGDVPASIAHYMTALYIPEVIEMARAGGIAGAPAGMRLTLRGGGLLRRLETPLNAVVGFASGPSPARPVAAAGAARHPPPPQVFTLTDLKIDPVLVRRRDDHRGTLEPAPRPLVTLQSATAVAALLRRP